MKAIPKSRPLLDSLKWDLVIKLVEGGVLFLKVAQARLHLVIIKTSKTEVAGWVGLGWRDKSLIRAKFRVAYNANLFQTL